MGLFLRKSVKIGFLRFNLSKSGVGASVGIKGFRVGGGPRGSYVHMGANGLYYRKSFGKGGFTQPKVGSDNTSHVSSQPDPHEGHVTVFESAPVSGLTDETNAEFLDELNNRASRKPWALWVALFATIAFGFISMSLLTGVSANIAASSLSAPIVHVIDEPGLTHTVQRGDQLAAIADQYEVELADLIRWNGIQNVDLIEVGEVVVVSETHHRQITEERAQAPRITMNDILIGILGVVTGTAALVSLISLPILLSRYRINKNTALIYDFDDEAERDYEYLFESLQDLASCQCIWNIETSQQTTDQKRNAGADALIQRSSIRASRSQPPSIKTNIDVFCIPAGRQTLYFLPDRLLIREGQKYAALDYSSVKIQAGSTQFIEVGAVPRDSTQVDTTWQYTNKKGGPDKRFKDNRQLPVMQYGDIHLTSASGLNERFNTSNPAVVSRIAKAIAKQTDVKYSPGPR